MLAVFLVFSAQAHAKLSGLYRSGFGPMTMRTVSSGTNVLLPRPTPDQVVSGLPSASAAMSARINPSCDGWLPLATTEMPLRSPPAATCAGRCVSRPSRPGWSFGTGTGGPTFLCQPPLTRAMKIFCASARPSDNSGTYQISTRSGCGVLPNSFLNNSTFIRRGSDTRRNSSNLRVPLLAILIQLRR
jgi:hypothetical protein